MSFWIHGSSSGHIDFSNDLAAILAANSVSVAAINSGGTGYVVGDILGITETGGTTLISAQIEVTSVAAGVIDGVRIYNSGSYSTNPTTLTGNALTGGTGSSATINLTMSDLGWTVDRNAVWDGGSEREVIAHGEGGGTDAIYVGWRTLSNVGGDYYNWECHGFTGFSASLPHNEQPGASPGDHEVASPGDLGTYMILTSSAFNWWVNISPYRIVITAAVGSAYFHTYLGWGNRFGTSTEYPYPMFISCPSEIDNVNSTRTEKMSSITDPWSASATTTTSHTLVYMPGGGWQQFVNRRATSPYDDNCVAPTQRPQVAYQTPSLPIDLFMSNNGAFYDLIYSISSGSGGTTTANALPTGDDDDRLMLPCFLVGSAPTVQILMEIDDCRWCNNFGGVSSEDRFIESDGTAWRVFANGNRTDTYAYIAIKEAS